MDWLRCLQAQNSDEQGVKRAYDSRRPDATPSDYCAAGMQLVGCCDRGSHELLKPLKAMGWRGRFGLHLHVSSLALFYDLGWSVSSMRSESFKAHGGLVNDLLATRRRIVVFVFLLHLCEHLTNQIEALAAAFLDVGGVAFNER